MILYKYNTKVEKLDADGAYFMPDDLIYATNLLNSNMFSNEVNIINQFNDKFIEKGSNLNFIDIGANVGTYTIVLGKVFGHTYSFEPNKHTFNIMCGNVAMHDLSYKTDLYNVGLSDKEESLEYHYIDFSGGGNMFVKSEEKEDLSNTLIHQYDWYHDDDTRSEVMPVKTLDSYNIKNVGLIKIDVEGFELNVLKGGYNTLVNSNFPPIIIESWNVNDYDDDEIKEAKIKLRSELFDYLNTIGYKVSNLNNDVFYCEK